MRVTVGVFLLRFAVLRIHRSIIHFLNAVGVLYSAVYLATAVFHCVPLNYFWERYGREGDKLQGTCFAPELGVKVMLGTTVVAAVTDWTFGLLPVWMMWDLRLSWGRKAAVCCMLGLGAL